MTITLTSFTSLFLQYVNVIKKKMKLFKWVGVIVKIPNKNVNRNPLIERLRIL